VPEISRERWVAWAAGFIDGEGCVALVRDTTRGTYVRLSVGQRTREPLTFLCELFGGSIHQEKTRPMWKWVVSHRTASKALTELLPYLVVKQDQAALALRFQSRRRVGGKRGAVNPQQDDQDYLTMKALKRPWLAYA